MARTLRILLLGALVSTSLATLPGAPAPAAAAELDRKGKSDAKQAMRSYKEGNYEDAARLFLRLSMAYPEMLVFVRNLGACYYYMRRYEPALSNLRDYLHRKTDIAADDRAEVAGWIGEMERLRDQATAPPAAAVAPPPAAPTPSPPAASPGNGEGTVPTPPVGAAVPVPAGPAAGAAGAPESAAEPAVPAPPAVAAPAPVPPAAPPSPSFPPGAPAIAPDGPPSPAAEPSFPPHYSPPGQYPAQPDDAPPGRYPPPPGYAADGQYGAHPDYSPQGVYVQPQQYPPAGAPGYPPGYAPPPGSPAEGSPVAVTAPAAPPPPPSRAGRVVAGVLLSLAGVATTGVGGYFTYKAYSNAQDLEKKYDPAKEDKRKTAVVVSGVCYGLGGAALVTGIIIASTGGSSGHVALSPVVGPGMAGATLGGRF